MSSVSVLGLMTLGNGELHVDATNDEVRPGLSVEGGLTLVVTLNEKEKILLH